MKKLIILLIVIASISEKAKGQNTYTVTMNVSPNWLSYNVGDTLKFYTPTTSTYTMYATTVSTIAHGIVINSIFPSSIGYVGKYPVQCSDTIIQMTNTNSQYYSLNNDVLASCNAGIAKYTTNNTISIYPNPAKEMLNVELGIINENTTLQITDMLGNTVKQFSIHNSPFQISVADLSEGVYTLQISTSSNLQINKKVVIVR
ncbi:MAG: T9SS type A sorting domain-containing protein [Bacteroidia bacterium]